MLHPIGLNKLTRHMSLPCFCPPFQNPSFLLSLISLFQEFLWLFRLFFNYDWNIWLLTHCVCWIGGVTATPVLYPLYPPVGTTHLLGMAALSALEMAAIPSKCWAVLLSYSTGNNLASTGYSAPVEVCYLLLDTFARKIWSANAGSSLRSWVNFLSPLYINIIKDSFQLLA